MKKYFLCLAVIVACLASSLPSAASVKIYFKNNANWGKVKAYFYYRDNTSFNNGWPGEEMTYNSSLGLWEYTLNNHYQSTAAVIFTDYYNSGNQFPGSGKDGLPIDGIDMICASDGSTGVWTEYRDQAFTVYFDNSSKNWNTPYIHYWGQSSTSWPGVEMTRHEGNIWKYTVPAGTAGIIFSNNGSNQTADLTAKASHKYNSSGTDQGLLYPNAMTVYFDNSGKNWIRPHIHYWGSSSTTWPGVEMQRVDGNGRLYKYTVPAGTVGIKFTDGSSNGEKTNVNYAPVPNHVYTAVRTTGADNGAYSSSYSSSFTMPSSLKILSTLTSGNLDPSKGTAMTKSGNTFTASNVRVTKYLTFVTQTGSDWNAVNGGDRFAPRGSDKTLSLTDHSVSAHMNQFTGSNRSSAKSWILPKGIYTVTADISKLMMSATMTKGIYETSDFTLGVTAPEAFTNDNVKLDVSLKPASGITLSDYTFDVTLPAGLTAGTPYIAFQYDTRTVTSSTVNGKLRVTVTSPSGTHFTSSDNVHVYIPVSTGTATGTSTVSIAAVEAALDGFPYEFTGSASGSLTVKARLPESVSLSETMVVISKGATRQLTATVLPANADNKTVTWTSSDTSVATVAGGLITATGGGTATITTTTVNGLTARCTVVVGKTAQTITWTQDLDELPAGKPVTFNATASSGLDVTYTIVNGDDIATLTGANFKGTKAGMVVVTASQEGNATYAPATSVSKVIMLTVGDPSDNGGTTMLDVTKTIDYIIGNNPASFYRESADINGDGSVDVVDVTLMVKIILDAEAQRHAIKAYAADADTDHEQFNALLNGRTLDVSCTNMSDYIAANFGLILPDGCKVESASVTGTDHAVSFRNFDDGYCSVLVFSMNNTAFSPDSVIRFNLSKTVSEPIQLVDATLNGYNADGTDILETRALGTTSVDNVPTGILSISADSLIEVYTLQGVRIYCGEAAAFTPTKGIFIVRAGDKVMKIIK